MKEKITPKKLDKSLDERLVPGTSMVDALNVFVSGHADQESSDAGDSGVLKSVRSNESIPYSTGGANGAMVEGTFRVIGSTADNRGKVLYMYVWSSIAAEHGVFAYDPYGLLPIADSKEKVVKVFQSDIFDFDQNGFVTGDIVYINNSSVDSNSTDVKDRINDKDVLLYFTDNKSEPKKLNIYKSLLGDYEVSSQVNLKDYVSACPKLGLSTIGFEFLNDPTKSVSNFTNTKGFQFAYQLIYKDGVESAISPYSDIAFPDVLVQQGSSTVVDHLLNNLCQLTLPSVVDDVPFRSEIEKIRLLAREGNDGFFVAFDEFNKDENLEVESNGTFNQIWNATNNTYKFYNDKVVTGVDVNEVNKQFDSLPRKAESQAIIGNRLMYANYLDGFDEVKVNCTSQVIYKDRPQDFFTSGITVRESVREISGSDPSGKAKNKTSGYIIDCTGLPETLPEGTEINFTLNISPNYHYHLYNADNSYHQDAIKGDSKDYNFFTFQDQEGATVTNESDFQKTFQDSTKSGQDFLKGDLGTPSMMSYFGANSGVLAPFKWRVHPGCTVPVDATSDAIETEQEFVGAIGTSAANPFIIPSSGGGGILSFGVKLEITNFLGGDVSEQISRAICQALSGVTNFNLTDVYGDNISLVEAVTVSTLNINQNNQAFESFLDSDPKGNLVMGVSGILDSEQDIDRLGKSPKGYVLLNKGKVDFFLEDHFHEDTSTGEPLSAGSESFADNAQPSGDDNDAAGYGKHEVRLGIKNMRDLEFSTCMRMTGVREVASAPDETGSSNWQWSDNSPWFILPDLKADTANSFVLDQNIASFPAVSVNNNHVSSPNPVEGDESIWGDSNESSFYEQVLFRKNFPSGSVFEYPNSLDIPVASSNGLYFGGRLWKARNGVSAQAEQGGTNYPYGVADYGFRFTGGYIDWTYELDTTGGSLLSGTEPIPFQYPNSEDQMGGELLLDEFLDQNNTGGSPPPLGLGPQGPSGPDVFGYQGYSLGAESAQPSSLAGSGFNGQNQLNTRFKYSLLDGESGPGGGNRIPGGAPSAYGSISYGTVRDWRERPLSETNTDQVNYGDIRTGKIDTGVFWNGRITSGDTVSETHNNAWGLSGGVEETDLNPRLYDLFYMPGVLDPRHQPNTYETQLLLTEYQAVNAIQDGVINQGNPLLSYETSSEIITYDPEDYSQWWQADSVAPTLGATAIQSFYYDRGSEKSNIEAYSAGQATGGGVNRSFKTNAYHNFGVVYYDERGRHGFVNPIDPVYVPGYSDSERGPGGKGRVEIKLNLLSAAPSWASNFKIVYSKNTSVSNFVQYMSGGAYTEQASNLSDSSIIYVSLNYLQETPLSYTSAFGARGPEGELNLYSFKEGDRVRVVSYSNSNGERVYPYNFVFDVIGVKMLGPFENPLFSDQTTTSDKWLQGQFLMLRNNPVLQGFSANSVESFSDLWGDNCVIEILSPTKTKEQLLYYEIPDQSFEDPSGNKLNYAPIVSNGNHYPSTLTVVQGDVWWRPIAMNVRKQLASGVIVSEQQNASATGFLDLIENPESDAAADSFPGQPNFLDFFVEAETASDLIDGDSSFIGRPNAYLPGASEAIREATITYSDFSQPESSKVNYSSFNASLANWKDLNEEFGEISFMANDSGDALVIQKDSVCIVPAGKNVFSDATGSDTVVASKAVLGSQRYFPQRAGCDGNPESVAKIETSFYFAHKTLGEIYKYTPSQGITVISEKSMSSYFRDLFSKAMAASQQPDYSDLRIVGGYDPITSEYLLTVLDNLEFEEVVRDFILGCTNPASSNYNPEANLDDGSCQFDEEGCGLSEVLTSIPGVIGSTSNVPSVTIMEGQGLNNDVLFTRGYQNIGTAQVLLAFIIDGSPFEQPFSSFYLQGETEPLTLNQCYIPPNEQRIIEQRLTFPSTLPAAIYQESISVKSSTPSAAGDVCPDQINFDQWTTTIEVTAEPPPPEPPVDWEDLIENPCDYPQFVNAQGFIDAGLIVSVYNEITAEAAEAGVTSNFPDFNEDGFQTAEDLLILLANLPPVQCFTPGCTDPNDSNYNPEATQDDGSCADVCLGQPFTGNLCDYPLLANVAGPNAGEITLASALQAFVDLFIAQEGSDASIVDFEGGTEMTFFYPDLNGDCNITIQDYLVMGTEVQAQIAVLQSAELTALYEAAGGLEGTGLGQLEYLNFLLMNTDYQQIDSIPCEGFVSGCTNPLSDNYNADAIVDDGSCVISGCTDPNALNYNPDATTDNGTCSYEVVEGCTDPEAANYNPLATNDNGSCEYRPPNLRLCDLIDPVTCTVTLNSINEYFDNNNDDVFVVDQWNEALSVLGMTAVELNCRGLIRGCTDPNAVNYSGPCATEDDGSCVYRGLGCTDPTALNYDPDANIDDGSCEYPVLGCTNRLAQNFDPNATEDDGSCIIPGCTDPRSNNYNPLATEDDGSCIYLGCMDPTALNYDELANQDNGSCRYPGIVYGCMDPLANNYNPEATEDDHTCRYENPAEGEEGGLGGVETVLGCTDPGADNYNPEATRDDGSCIYGELIPGCTIPEADNYDPEATFDDGTCILRGCTNPLSGNYNPQATINDGSCTDPIGGCMNPASPNYNPNATFNDGSCQPQPAGEIYGCMDPNASNYNENATHSDGSCEYF